MILKLSPSPSFQKFLKSGVPYGWPGGAFLGQDFELL